MDDTYRINVAKTEFREGYNCGNVNQLLSTFEEEGFTDMSEDGPSHYGKAARDGLRERSSALFAEYSVKLIVPCYRFEGNVHILQFGLLG